MSDFSNLDKQIEQLMNCKPLLEQEVKSLCDKVSIVMPLIDFYLCAGFISNMIPS